MLTGYCSPPARDNHPVLQVHGAARRSGIEGGVHAAGQLRNEQAVKLASFAERELADLIALGRVGCQAHCAIELQRPGRGTRAGELLTFVSHRLNRSHPGPEGLSQRLLGIPSDPTSRSPARPGSSPFWRSAGRRPGRRQGHPNVPT